jgi:hypothetical protein
MKRQVELAILGGLILFMSFTPGFAPVRTLLSTAVGRMVGLVAVVYVFKYVSAPIGLLLAIHFARCSRMGSVWEGVDETLTEMCECDPDFTYNSGTKMCEKMGAESKKPVRCACVPGENWDEATKTCVPKKVESALPMAPPESMPATGGAELSQVAGPPAPGGGVPETTGSAAGTAMASAPTTTPPPATEKFSPMDSPMIRGKQYSPW